MAPQRKKDHNKNVYGVYCRSIKKRKDRPVDRAVTRSSLELEVWRGSDTIAATFLRRDYVARA